VPPKELTRQKPLRRGNTEEKGFAKGKKPAEMEKAKRKLLSEKRSSPDGSKLGEGGHKRKAGSRRAVRKADLAGRS